MNSAFDIKFLEWDSTFFNKKIGKLELAEASISLSELNIIISNTDFDLIYLFVPPSVAIKEVLTNINNALLVDEKTTYYKHLQQSTFSSSPNIKPVVDMDNALVDLAVQTGSFSRFNIDPNFERTAYKRMYTEWIKNSLNHSIADEVFVFENGQKKLGLVTVGKKGTRADIGLLGVDTNARGQGIASALIAKVEEFALNNKFEELQVVTQGGNKPACMLYEKCGFAVESVINIFHVWKH